ncbi:maleylpyruvate isomerase family mycothiol-dependent enzyme [Nonomuraea terrae]|uniref:Maleylpyruvate isomerase family mycothiol-dependent enzyme n=1 Tax=Nonomuraea terrae TaxID=2530383 RepID=A0A4R4XSY7_9ACTN|nr:maleylpyruvate isomerase family mycothiol-dependent enzyme [Nonomuraea terrae]TDD34436.1 maleylpyruvate isomerase family mycothiol-dependent enzyme [Nonomuraea terrae]
MVTWESDRLMKDLREQTAGLARAAAAGDPEATVPTCPEWRLSDLVAHIGQAPRWAADLVRKAAPLPIPDPREVDPGAPAGWERWLTDGAEELIEAVGDAGEHAEVWSVVGMVPPAFWLRRMLNDITVHHYDAAAATGAPFEISAELAADVITEGMELLSAPAAEDFKPELAELRGSGECLAIRPYDAEGWLISRTPDGPRWERASGDGDVTVRGPAAELMLVLTGRVPAREVTGDRELLDHWLAHTRF